MGHWEQHVTDVTYSKPYQTTCRQRTCVPRVGCTEYDTPCIKTRKYTASFTLVADFPDDATDEQKAQIIACAAASVAVAAAVASSTYLARAPIVGPGLAAIEAAAAAIDTCRGVFDPCISGLPDDIKNRTGIAMRHTVEESFYHEDVTYTSFKPLPYMTNLHNPN